MEGCMNGIEEAAEERKEFETVLANHRALIRSVQDDGAKSRFSAIEIAKVIYEDVEKKSKSGVHHAGVLCGIKSLDSRIEGFEPGTLTYIVARPSVGKTALALSMARNMGFQYQDETLFFSIEMAVEPLGRRLMAAESNVFAGRLRRGTIEDKQWASLIQAANRLGNCRLTILYDRKLQSIEHLVSMAESISLERPVTAVFVDHIQKLSTWKRVATRHHEISQVSNQLAILGKEIGAPIICLCQLSRRVENRNNKHPLLSDLKESGDLGTRCGCRAGFISKK